MSTMQDWMHKYDIDGMRRRIERSIFNLFREEPFIGSMVGSITIMADPTVEAASTDGRIIFLNPDFLNNISDAELDFSLAHEALHIVFQHPYRFEEYIPKIINFVKRVHGVTIPPDIARLLAYLAMELHVNSVLDVYTTLKAPHFVYTCENTLGIPNEECAKESLDEVLETILKNIKFKVIPVYTSLSGQSTCPIESPECGTGGSGEAGESKEDKGEGAGTGKSKEKTGGTRKTRKETKGGAGEEAEKETGEKAEKGAETRKAGRVEGRAGAVVVTNQDGKPIELPAKSDMLPPGYNSGKGVKVNEGETGNIPPEHMDQVMDVTLKSLTFAKMIGRLPGFFERIVGKLLKPKVDWKSLLRNYMRSFIGRNIRRTWSRPSKKLPDLRPGIRREGVEVVVVVDTSGSISEEELQRFVSEVYEIAREASKVTVIPFDARAYDEIVINRQYDVKNIKLTGGGGTMIKEALEKVMSKYRDADVVIILSDWYIGDLDDPEVQDMLKRISWKTIAVTSKEGAEPPEYLRNRIRLTE